MKGKDLKQINAESLEAVHTHTHTHTGSASGYLVYNKIEYKYVSGTQEKCICGCRYVSSVSYCCA